mmetsp:Transcript_32925/g.48698  ORF Transcript_32925/g.48698 Transcript_32925/m.48698 type:complete len:335 (+) Transcript_32925:104-1108(+)
MPELDDNASSWRDSIVSTLQGCAAKGGAKRKMAVKDLRKVVLLSMQLDPSDKKCKRQFKNAVQALEENKIVSLNAEGIVRLKKKGDKRKLSISTETGSGKKIKKSSNDDEHKGAGGDGNEIIAHEDTEQDVPLINQKVSCKGNPQGVTRLFLGNLPFTVDEASLGAFLPGTLTHIKWITDKETGKFYGSAFCEMDTAENAAEAVALAGQKLLGRPIKINFAPARPGDVWPPEKKVITGGQAGGTGVKAMSEKPSDCMKLFVGNLSYDIDDDAITKFFSNVDAEVKAVRWLHHKDTGDFKGVGFVEFWNTEACERGATLNGKNLLERPIRIDWTD